jgi:serine/threonine protein phosphatase PrpC
MKYATVKEKGVPNYQEDDYHNMMLDSTKYLAIFDGHGGSICSQFLACNFWGTLLEKNNTKNEGIVKSFLEIDRNFKEVYPQEAMNIGSTLGAVIAQRNKDNTDLTIMNVGDSRCALFIQSQLCSWTTHATIDHKPNNELDRILKSGSKVVRNRVNTRLAVSRAFGDWSFKQADGFSELEQAVICVPDIYRYHVPLSSNAALVLATDGLWDVLSTDDVLEQLKGSTSAQSLAEELVGLAIKKNSRDNITVTVAFLQEDTC